MQLLTPELYCLSSFYQLSVIGHQIVTRQLDFNLARRSGILVNQIVSTLNTLPYAVADQYTVCQELDLDPDNVEVWQGSAYPDAVEYDSSRLLRHVISSIEMAAGDKISAINSILIKEWHNVPLEKRPISITPVRHHIASDGGLADHLMIGQLHIYYHIVELDLKELGILNASRR
ncbi:hypothetical protein ES703_97838 [subsurface metagenome]